MSFGNRLKIARKNKKLTQSDVSKKLGIDFTTVSKYENDKSEPDRVTILKLSKLYDVHPAWLLTGEDPEKINNHVESDAAISATEAVDLIRELAIEYGMKPDDPLFKEMLSDAINLLRIARGKNSD